MKYMTVSQYAALVNRDTSVIRRLIASGDIKAKKLGSQWVLPKDTKYPADRRVKNGDYKNWREISKIRKRNPVLMKKLSKMCGEIGILYGSHIEKIVMYGSYARGEETEESDVDVAVILKGEDSEDLHDKMTDIVVDYELDQGVTLSVITIEYNDFLEWKVNLPFYRNIDREGIILWKAV